jgi:hypothetical protein
MRVSGNSGVTRRGAVDVSAARTVAEMVLGSCGIARGQRAVLLAWGGSGGSSHMLSLGLRCDYFRDRRTKLIFRRLGGGPGRTIAGAGGGASGSRRARGSASGS